MRSITVFKRELIATLSENKAKHAAEYEAAMIGWREKVLQALVEADRLFRVDDDISGLNVGYTLPAPTNYTEEYDRALEMLRWETADQIQLSEEDFRHLVQNEWAWSRSFNNLSAAYTSRD